MVLASYSFGVVVISALLSLPIALFSLAFLIEPRRQAAGKDPLNYWGCLLYALVLAALLSPLGFGIFILAKRGLGIFQ
ncbi:MAG: hypothetical protein MK291_09435 [Planctomycetes bacterium]|nr:hypothetical protein [Planctomycetota bacterium]